MKYRLKLTLVSVVTVCAVCVGLTWWRFGFRDSSTNIQSSAQRPQNARTKFIEAEANLPTEWETSPTTESLHVKYKQKLQSIRQESDPLKRSKLIAEYRGRPRAPSEVEALVLSVKRELGSEYPDWLEIQNCFVTASAGVQDSRMFEYALQVVEMPKPKILPKRHSLCIISAMSMMGYHGNTESQQLLEEYAEVGFWDAQDFESEMFKEATNEQYRVAAVIAIRRLPAPMARESLEGIVKAIHSRNSEEPGDARVLRLSTKFLDELSSLPSEEYVRFYSTTE